MAARKGKSSNSELIDRDRDILSGLSAMTSGAFWMAAPDYTEVLYLSPAVEKIYGLPASDLYATPRLWLESTYPDDLRTTREIIKKSKGNKYEIERRIVRPDGTTVWVLETVFPIRDVRGRNSHIVGFSEDITVRKGREIDLLESEKRYRTLVDTSNDGIAVIQDDKMVFFNDLIVERTGYSREEISATSFSQLIHPDDLATAIDRYTNRLKTKATEGSIEIRVLTKDKREIYTEINVATTDWGGRPALLCFFRDVTEKKLADRLVKDSEEKYRALVNSSNDAIIVIQDQLIVFSNRKAQEILGVTENELIGRPMIDFIDPAYRQMMVDNYARRMRGESFESIYEFNAITKKGEIVPAETSTVVTTWNGRPAHLSFIRDATQRKATETALRESEERYRDLVENIEDIIYVVDGKGKFLFVNDALARLGGFRKEAASQHYFTEVITAESYGRAKEIFKRQLAGEDAGVFELDFRNERGDSITLQTRERLIWKDGRVSEVHGIGRDITQLKKAEKDLILRERELNNIFEFTGTAMIIVDEDMTIAKCNQEFEQLTGYVKAKIERRMKWTWFVHPDDIDRTLGYLNSRRLADAAVPPHYESRAIDRNGIVKHIYITSGSMPGTKQTIVAILDISDRKRSENALRESEEKLRNLFDTSKDVIFLSTIMGWFYDINQAGEDLFGYSRDELLMLDTQDIYKNEGERQVLHEEMERLGFVKDREVVFKRKDGTFIDCLITATLRKDKDGNVIGYQGIIKDISERKRLEEHLASAKKMEAIGTLAGGMAHNFNNILVGIMGYSEMLLRKKEASDPDYKALSIIHEGTISASKLTKELLSIFRGADYTMARLDLNTLVQKFIPLIEGTMDKSIEIKGFFADDLPLIQGDMSQIQQCLLNLCINARDAMPGGGELVIETYRQHVSEDFVRAHLGTRAGDYAVVSITDTGEGISEENKPHIFEPFFSTKDHKRGTGLGLSTVWGIMKNHRGLITVYSEPNEGTTFKLYFPAVPGRYSQPSVAGRGDAVPGSGTILLIDDEPIVRDTWSDALSERGYRVIVAEDGVAGIDIFREKKDSVDLVILDFVMPRMGGKETFLKLKEIKPDVKVLVSSGYGLDDTVWEGSGDRADGFIQKPCRISNLTEKVGELLGKP